MKQVRGFIANDGTFFETREACTLYETECDLREAAVFGQVSPEAFLQAVNSTWEPLGRYIDARRAAIKANISSGNEKWTEGDTDTVQQQSPSVGEPVSDLGRRKFKEKIREQRKGDGS